MPEVLKRRKHSDGRRWLLSHDIARDVMIGAASIAVLCGIMFAFVFYATLDKQEQQSLSSHASYMAQRLDEGIEENAAPLDVVGESWDVSFSEYRVTLIDPDGTVLYDNQADVRSMDNHSSRPEVEAALKTGEGADGRHSATLNEETLYHSVRLDDGSVLRLAITKDSVWGVMGTMVVPCLVVVILAVFISALVGLLVARRISATLSDVDLDNPLAEDVPEELVPLLVRLNDQRKRIDAQASERRRFTASVSHELKTPLTVISGYAEIIEKGIAKPEDVAQFAGHIHTEAQHMKSIVDDLLVLSRLDDAESPGMRVDMDQEVSLGKMARNAIQGLKPMAESQDVSMAVKAPEDDGLAEIIVQGNQRMLEEMVRNLIENAIRYNAKGGKVEVRVARDANGHATLSVSDTGTGIPEELREKVFERFFCVDESRSKEKGGTGLGLAIVKHAVQLHGASIVVRSNVPHGTVFEVTF